MTEPVEQVTQQQFEDTEQQEEQSKITAQKGEQYSVKQQGTSIKKSAGFKIGLILIPITIIVVAAIVLVVVLVTKDDDDDDNVNKKVIDQFPTIDADHYRDIVSQMIQKSKEEEFKGQTYKTLAEMVDTYGPRMWGSDSLNDAINFLEAEANKMGFDNVNKEALETFSYWKRGDEYLELTQPRVQKLAMTGVAYSGKVGEVQGEVIVVKTLQEIKDMDVADARGKIICLNYDFTGYLNDSGNRALVGYEAEQKQAIGALVRSVTPTSIYSPHGGSGRKSNIPVAAITIEDANMLSRMQERGQTIEVKLKQEGEIMNTGQSFNLQAEITGSENPEEIVLFGGHIDSWDIGGSQTGATDDGGVVVNLLYALKLVKSLGLKPKRTMRFIAWAGEEQYVNSVDGAEQYLTQHESELENHVLAFEADEGNSLCYGFGVSGTDEAHKLLKYLQEEILAPELPHLTKYDNKNGINADTYGLMTKEVTVMKDLPYDSKDLVQLPEYYTHHHSAGDSMELVDSDTLDKNLVTFASMLYLVADVEPRVPVFPQTQNS